MEKLPEREKLIRDIDCLKESIRLALLNIGSEPMTEPDRRELLKSIGSLEKHLYDLRTRLGQLLAAGRPHEYSALVSRARAALVVGNHHS